MSNDGPVKMTVEQGLATVRMQGPGSNAINDELIAGLRSAFEEAERNEGVRGVLLASAGKLFSPGLDLPRLIEMDRTALSGFLGRFNELVHTMYHFPGPVVAALHGHAVAGGCVLALTADWRVLRTGAMVGLNEVRVGVTFPYGVTMMLRDAVPSRHVAEVALLGRNYRDDAAVQVGLVHEVQPEAEFDAACRERLADLASKEMPAFACTKRYLRSPVSERLEADARFAEEFLDVWFLPSTQARIREVVEALRKR